MGLLAFMNLGQFSGWACQSISFATVPCWQPTAISCSRSTFSRRRCNGLHLSHNIYQEYRGLIWQDYVALTPPLQAELHGICFRRRTLVTYIVIFLGKHGPGAEPSSVDVHRVLDHLQAPKVNIAIQQVLMA